MKKIDLDTIKIDATEYASQGNAILGIRDSGKSYTATYIAERLLDAGIPFVAFDPIGIWKYLRVPGVGKAYPIVVAGGRNGDLPLTVHSAPEIVRAAMRENIPLVLDFYSIKMSKSEWKQIVEQCVRLLLYENGDHGLRHIFIEEAAEFAPQRVGPDQGRVYAEIEKLARMGGNAQLGYTLINQRAEEVNKAVLELCDCLFLHRQKGKNSLTSLGKWLDIGDVSTSKEIIKSLPKMPQGECWVWLSGSDAPTHIKVPQKNTQHPDRRAMHQSGSGKEFKAVDVSSFVTQMSTTLEKHLAEAQANDPAQLRRRVAELEKHLKGSAPQIKTERIEVALLKESDIKRLEVVAERLHKIADSALLASTEIVSSIRQRQREARPIPADTRPMRLARLERPVPTSHGDVPLGSGERKILTAIAQHPEGVTREQLTVLTGYKRSSRDTYLQRLSARNFINTDRDRLQVTEDGIATLGSDFSPLPTGSELCQYWLNRLKSGERAVYECAIESYPDSISREAIDEKTGYKRSSRDTYIQRIQARRLITVDRNGIRASDHLFDAPIRR